LLYAAGMGYAILRVQKLKSVVAVRRSMKHAHREQDTPNADSERTPDNTHIGAQSADEGVAKVAALLPEKRRSDAVLCVEYLVTASPEAMAGKSREQQDAYLQDALEWIKERHGAANVVYAGIHRDETTPHLYAYAVPLDADTGRLNAKKWLGGAKALSQMQTEFADKIGKRHNLERGIEGSKAQHQRVKRHYAAIQQENGHVTISPAALEPRQFKAEGMVERLGISKRVETPEQVASRITQAVRQGYEPAVQAAAEARQARSEAKAARSTAENLQKRLKPVLDALGPLNRGQQAKAAAIIKALGEKLLGDQREAERQRIEQEQKNRIKSRGR
jgi:hypothetical protein